MTANLKEIRAYLEKDAALTDTPRLHPSSPTAMLRALLEDRDELEAALIAVKHHPDTPEHIREYVTRALAGDGGGA